MPREPDIAARLREIYATHPMVMEAAAEIERLHERIASLQASSGYEASIAQLEIERLRAALEPFARNINAISLNDALGHIGREHLQNARAALEPKP